MAKLNPRQPDDPIRQLNPKSMSISLQNAQQKACCLKETDPQNQQNILS